MSLEKLIKTVDFVQDTTPSASDVNNGETYLDTSLSPPQLKVFDSSVSSFIQPRSIQNIDSPISQITGGVKFIGGFQVSLSKYTGRRLNVSGQDSTPQAIEFGDNGKLMFITGRGSDLVHEYSLSSAFDLSTASVTGTSFDVSSEDSAPIDVTFNTDGTLMFIAGASSNSLYQYSLNSAFDIGTASFTGTIFDASGEDTRISGVEFDNDGTSMFVTGRDTNSVYQYSLTSAFDIGTASFTGTIFDVSGEDTSPQDMIFNSDGTLMFVMGLSSSSVYRYSLTSGFDIGTASFTGISSSVTEQASSPVSLAFNDDGTLLSVLGRISDSAYQYLIGTVAPE